MSAPAFNQDDARERAMIAVLNLEQRPDRGRYGEDAHLDVEWSDGHTHRLLFECKSAPEEKDYGTGRDTGLPQLMRWAGMHFVFGWFEARDNRPKRLWYGSPAMMRTWNEEQQAYLAPDLLLTELLPVAVDETLVDEVLGAKEVYTYDDLHRLLKDQWNAKKAFGRPNLYRANADVRSTAALKECRYSREMALRALRARAEYLLARGSTVNNRKISAAYVIEHCVELLPPKYAQNLGKAIDDALQAEPPNNPID